MSDAVPGEPDHVVPPFTNTMGYPSINASYRPFARGSTVDNSDDSDASSINAPLQGRTGRPRTRSREREQVRRGLFTPTSDVSSPEHLQRLLSTIETLREESGDNVQKLKAWVQEQQRCASQPNRRRPPLVQGSPESLVTATHVARCRGLQAWIHKQQPVPTRRLDCVGCILHMLQGEQMSGDLLASLDSLMRLDEGTLLSYLPLLCDAVVLDTGYLSQEQRASVRAFLLSYAAASQHAALHICWYLRAMGALARQVTQAPCLR